MNSVVLFGATGFTGRLTAHALMQRDLTPILAGRSITRLNQLQQDLAHTFGRACPVAFADSHQPASVQALITDSSDVLVSTVGPFTTHGSAALNAAIQAGSGYLDSTGEPPFIRHVFMNCNAPAKHSGARLLTAFGYDYVPGNLAGTIALRRCHELGVPATRIEIGYFIHGAFGISSGTKASAAAMLLEPSFAYHQGRLQTARTAKSVRTFVIQGKPRDALSIGGSEHFTLPRQDRHLTTVDVYLGWAGRMTKAAQSGSAALHALSYIPGASTGLKSLTRRFAPTGQGPNSTDRAKSVSVAVARAFRGDDLLTEVLVEGPSPYDLTAELLAWGADLLHQGRCVAAGAVGPAMAFGSGTFVAGCAELGLKECT
jgi:short subunit dehydrogenase-like uncharacterized protein